ncbi:hypothetical protein EON64_06555 [archaeon]|nr:MAG: hypothetical protein EON64_06555 [archaeon]
MMEDGGNALGIKKRAWKRVLYEKQPYRDNFYDADKFFSGLTVQKGSKYDNSGRLSYLTVFTYASMVLQHFSSVAFFFVNYKYLVLRLTSFSSLVKLDCLLLIMGVLVYYVFSEMPNKGSYLLEKSKVALMMGICLRLTAPVIQTLTLSFSEDTIYALAITFSVVHLAFHEYSPLSQSPDHFSAAISFNAAIFTAVLLASRLQHRHSVSMVMLFIVLAVLTFSLFPIVARLVTVRSAALHWLLVLLQWLATTVMLLRLDLTLLIVYEVISAVLFVVAPLLFLYMQTLKLAYHGPWDIAADT